MNLFSRFIRWNLSVIIPFVILLAGVVAAQSQTTEPLTPQQRRASEQTKKLYAQAEQLRNEGRFVEAIPIVQRILKIDEEAFSPTHSYVAADLNNLGHLYVELGAFALAIEPLERALKIREQRPESHALAPTLNNLAVVYEGMGDYDRAESLYLRAIKITEKTFGIDGPESGPSIQGLAVLFSKKGDYKKAKPLYERALRIAIDAYGEMHPFVAATMESLAGIYRNTYDYATAESLYLRALKIYSATVVPGHPRIGTALNNLGLLYHIQGNYKDAERAYLLALEIAKKALGKNHPEVAIDLNNLAAMYMATDPNKALNLFFQSLDVQQNNLNDVFSISSEKTMHSYLSTISSTFDLMFAAALTQNTDRPREEVLTWLLRRKGIILDTMIRFRSAQTLLASDPVVRQLDDQLRVLRRQISNLPLDSSGMSGPELEAAIARLTQKAELTEERLNRALTQRRPQQQYLPTANLSQVRNGLSGNAALVEFTRARAFNFKAKDDEKRWMPEHYYAFVVMASSSATPRVIDLGKAADVDKAIANLRTKIVEFKNDWKEEKFSGDDPVKNEQAEEATYRNEAKALFELIFAPLKPTLGAAKVVYLSPDSQLNLVPFEALVDENGNYLINSYRFSYLSSGRELLQPVAGNSGRGTVVFANPDYNMTAAARARKTKQLFNNTARTRVPSGPDPTPAAPMTIGLSTRGPTRGTSWEQLKSSSVEATEIRAKMQATVFGPVTSRLADEALEEMLKRVHSPRILHISTHGFFPDSSSQDGEALPVDLATGSIALLGQHLLQQTNNPLLDSGVVLNGANRFNEPRVDDIQDDGWVTADEISQMDLRGTELVVLSACGTGLGAISSGEGVYGLRRAFQLAGAGAIVSTLFEVPDEESAQLVGFFYEALRRRKSKLDALQEARLKLIEQRKKAALSSHPFFWAGFIVSGSRVGDGSVASIERAHAQTPGSLEQADVLYEEAIDLYRKGQYQEALKRAQKALAIRERLRGPYHEEVADSLNSLSIIYLKIGRYDSAEPLLTRALAIRLKRFGNKHPDYAQSLNSLAGLYKLTGRFHDAERRFKEALEIRRGSGDDKNPDVANSLSNLAALYDAMGRYSEAEPLYLEALEIRRNLLSEKHPDYATTLSNLARLYKVMGRYEKAEDSYLKVIEVRKNVLGEQHPDYAISLNNLAALYHTNGDLKRAEKLYSQASAIFKSAFGEYHPTYAISLNNLGMVLDNAGQYEKAITTYREAMQIYEKALGKNNADYANTVNNLGVLYRTVGNYAEAERLGLEALDIRKRVLGEDHPDYATSLETLAILYEKTGQFHKAMDYISRSLSVDQANLTRMLSVSSELAMSDYLFTLAAPYARLLTMAQARAKTNDAATAASTALSWTLNRKAVILDTLMRFREVQKLAGDDDTVGPLLARLRYLHQRVANLPLELHEDPDSIRIQNEIASLRTEVDGLEAQLNRVLSSSKKWSEPSDVSVEAVKRTLKPGEALIEFVRSYVYDFKADREAPRWKSEHYFAFVLTPNAGAPPRMIDLGEAKPIDDAIKELRGKIIAFKKDWQAGKLSGDDALKSEATEETSYRNAARELYTLVFARIKPDIAGASTLYVASDDQLNLVPFEGLTDEADKYLIEKYRFAYLSSGRDLLRRSTSQARGAVIFADPDFDMTLELRRRNVKLLVADLARVEGNAGNATRREAQREETPRDSSLAKDPLVSRRLKGGNWERLADSSKEAESIQQDLTGAVQLVNGKLHTYIRERALEDVFKLLDSPRLLHVSTHGFFLADDVAESTQGRLDVTSGNPAVVGRELLRRADEPLLSSGLVLAGANQIGQCSAADCAKVDDGWLTAEEISLMDLRGTELVVLSACGSGLGAVSPGEGVYGLRRAFQNAGARTIISTLFEVPELESGKIMRGFYRGLKNGKGKLDALREAQLQMIAEQRLQKGATHPFFWAGFILSGAAE